jgi:hypothetical protein
VANTGLGSRIGGAPEMPSGRKVLDFGCTVRAPSRIAGYRR